jgi:hypothetical protein
MRRHEILSRQEKVMQLHSKDFNPGMVKPKLKYEPLFLAPHELSTYTFLSAGDPYQASITERLRA